MNVYIRHFLSEALKKYKKKSYIKVYSEYFLYSLKKYPPYNIRGDMSGYTKTCSKWVLFLGPFIIFPTSVILWVIISQCRTAYPTSSELNFPTKHASSKLHNKLFWPWVTKSTHFLLAGMIFELNILTILSKTRVTLVQH